MPKLEGKVAIVTGAGLGQGKSTALRLAGEGAQVVAADITGAEKDTASEMPSSITPFHVDVTKIGDVEALVQEAVKLHGRLDIMCNVVGVADIAHGFIPNIDESEFDKLMTINVKSVLYGMKFAIPAMVSRGGGSIINWTSVGAVRPYRGTAAYSTSKAAVMTLTKVAALECAKDKIRVNAVSPGYIFPTGMSTLGGATVPAEGQLAIIPMDREGHPDEVASVVAFLASDDASYMTGTCVEIDGGKMAGWK